MKKISSASDSYLERNWYFDSVVDMLIIKVYFLLEMVNSIAECIGFHLQNYKDELISLP